jgi:hypothetical protein
LPLSERTQKGKPPSFSFRHRLTLVQASNHPTLPNRRPSRHSPSPPPSKAKTSKHPPVPVPEKPSPS